MATAAKTHQDWLDGNHGSAESATTTGNVMQLTGKTALITGGRRIGGKLARLLADRGANIALSYFTNRDAVEETAADCRERGVHTEIFQADLRLAEEAEGLIELTAERFGSLDVLINLTSIYTRTPWKELTPRDYDAMIASNLTAPYWTAARQMQRQPVVAGLQGKIIHFSDWAVDRPYRGFLPYLVAKGGLVTLTKALSVELAPTILVNAIAPGTIEPPPDLSQEQLERIGQSAALGRIGSPEDVNQAVLYLLEGTDFVTGEVFRVDGGRFLGPSDETQADQE
jgi:pteridine reductase